MGQIFDGFCYGIVFTRSHRPEEVVPELIESVAQYWSVERMERDSLVVKFRGSLHESGCSFNPEWHRHTLENPLIIFYNKTPHTSAKSGDFTRQPAIAFAS